MAFNYDAADNLLVAHEAKEAAARIRAGLNSPLTKSAKSESIVCRDRTGVRLWPWVGRKIVKAT